MLNILNQQKDKNSSNNSVSGIESKSQSDYRKYRDTTGEFGSKELGYSLWWVKHKVLLYRTIIGILVIANLAFWVTSLIKWTFVGSDLLNNKKFESELTEFHDYTEVQQQFAPKPLLISSTNLYPGGKEKFDAVSEVQNPNERFVAKVNYYFIIGGVTTTLNNTIILPGETTLLAHLGIDGENLSPGSAMLQIHNLEWERVSTHKYPDPGSWQKERLNFEISNFNFSNQMMNPELKVNRIVFTLKNNSAFSFKEPAFYVALYDNETFSGIMPLQTSDFKSLEEKQVDLRNFVPNIRVQSIKVYPRLNVYDKGIYLQPER